MSENQRPRARGVSPFDFGYLNHDQDENNDNTNYYEHGPSGNSTSSSGYSHTSGVLVSSNNANNSLPLVSTPKGKGTASEKRVDFASLMASSKRKGGRGGNVRKSGKGKKGGASRTSPRRAEKESENEGGGEWGLDPDVDVSMVVDTPVQQRMQLISPPPEETLSLRRTSRQFSTPGLLNDREASPSALSATVTAKRKRSTQVVQQQEATGSGHPDSTHVNATLSVADAELAELQQAVEATPNPKPRKQKRHTRTISVESPTKAAFRTSTPPRQMRVDDEDEDVNMDMLVTPLNSKSKHLFMPSPHAKNPEADYIPPVPVPLLVLSPGAGAGATARRAVLGAKGSRRSVTPIPPYEPPSDVFTPPRQVFLTPTVKPSSRRKTTFTPAGKKKGRKTDLRIVTTQVKQEIPDDIDLTAPMPPPSPTDDPLLLSGPPEPELELWITIDSSSPLPEWRPKEVARRSVSVQAEAEPESEGPFDFGTLPPSSPEPALDSEDIQVVNEFETMRQETAGAVDSMPTSMEESMMDDPAAEGIEPVRLFDGPAGDWSDSDDDNVPVDGVDNAVEEGEGHYTGHFRTIRVPTKQDPPSSTTRVRQEQWGRPISPFPYSKTKTLPEAVQEEDEEEREVREMSFQLEEEPEIDEAPAQQETEILQSTIRVEVEPPSEGAEARSLSPRPQESDAPASEPGPFDFSIVEAEDSRALPMPEFVLEGDNDEEESDSDMDNDPSLVKITSADPRAAARAVAILKQHDYDCYTKIAMKRRHTDAKQRRASHSMVDSLIKDNRRRDLSFAGISKSSNRRKSTLAINVVGERVYFPGSPATTLPLLLQNAEAEVSRELLSPLRLSPRILNARASAIPHHDLFQTPISKSKQSKLLTATEYRGSALYTAGEWTREEWKLLDACFTDERLDIGETLEVVDQDGLAPVGMISIEAVVERFISFVGGEEIISKRSEAWSRSNLMERTRALQKKQRSGKVAPPTTPRSSSAGLSPILRSATLDAFGGSHRIPLMEVPDFTPLGRRAAPPHKSRPVLPPPIVQEAAPFSGLQEKSVPATLLAPRYSHLLEEAVAISQGEFAHPVPSKDHDSDQPHELFEGPSAEYNQENMSHSVEDSLTNETVTPHTPIASHPDPNPPDTLGKRVKGFLFSYLPTLRSKPTSSLPSQKPRITIRQPGLPLPPPEILEKSRGTIATPARPPLAKPKHPKEQVHLNPAPLPQVPSAIPRRVVKPQRLVELRHLSPPTEVSKLESIPRPRRSSGSSVRDLVKGYEELQKSEREKALSTVGNIKRVRSIGEMKWRKNALDTRPKWKP